MKSHIVKKIHCESINSEDIWQSISKIEIDCFPWDTNGYMPKSEVQMFYTDKYFKLRFSTQERDVRATYLNLQDPVYQDSCMEFFMMPDTQGEGKYLNFEFNAFGTLLLGMGNNRHNRVSVNVDPAIFEIKTSLNSDNIDRYDGSNWTIEFKIPFDFLDKYFKKIDFISGHTMKANFYKCGDNTDYPHYGCWNQIENEKPDFHLPQYFGELILE